MNASIPAPLEEISNALLNAVFQFDSITHNRLRVPEDLPVLSFDVFKPFMFTEGAAVDVTIQVEGLEDFVETVSLDTGFFSNHTYSVCVPPVYRGRMATITLTHRDLADTTFVSYDPADLVAGVLEAPINTISQLYLLDDIRFEAPFEDQIDVTSSLDETGSATLTVTLDPDLGARRTHCALIGVKVLPRR